MSAYLTGVVVAERAGSGDACDLAGLVSGPVQLYRRGKTRGGGGGAVALHES